jgi:hypothetical protein
MLEFSKKQETRNKKQETRKEFGEAPKPKNIKLALRAGLCHQPDIWGLTKGILQRPNI